MSNILVFTAEERERLTKIMRNYGMSVNGGSIDYEEEQAYVGVDYNGATYNGLAAATTLGKQLGVNTVILNGLKYTISA